MFELDPDSGADEDFACLVTNDRGVAEKFGMEDEAEFWDADDEKPGENAGFDESQPTGQ